MLNDLSLFRTEKKIKNLINEFLHNVHLTDSQLVRLATELKTGQALLQKGKKYHL